MAWALQRTRMEGGDDHGRGRKGEGGRLQMGRRLEDEGRGRQTNRKT